MRSHVGQKIYLQVELSREAEDNATSRGLHRIPSPAEAGRFQTAGLTAG
jgi:hypothetical protein